MNFSTILKYLNYKLTASTDHDLHSPFLFEFYNELIINPYPFSDFKKLKAIRKQLRSNYSSILVNDFGAGSRKLKTANRNISAIARYGIAQQKQAEFLYRLVNKFKPNTIIELGTSLGLTSLYLSMASAESTIYTLEGCTALHEFSNKLFATQKVKNIKSIIGNFNDTFAALLSSIDFPGLIYVDGNHAYEPTMHYFKMALANKNSSTIIVFDDIYWSKEMEKAWKEICAHAGVTLSIDMFYFGIIFFRTEQKNKEHFVLRF